MHFCLDYRLSKDHSVLSNYYPPVLKSADVYAANGDDDDGDDDVDASADNDDIDDGPAICCCIFFCSCVSLAFWAPFPFWLNVGPVQCIASAALIHIDNIDLDSAAPSRDCNGGGDDAAADDADGDAIENICLGSADRRERQMFV